MRCCVLAGMKVWPFRAWSPWRYVASKQLSVSLFDKTTFCKLFLVMSFPRPQVHLYKCPSCSKERNAVEVAEGLPDEVLRLVTARRNAHLRKNRSVAGGRPALARCPGCDLKMATVDLREHRLPCIRQRLDKLQHHEVRLIPKDPDPYPNFSIKKVLENEVVFKKLSSSQHLTIELQKVAEITPIDTQGLSYIRLLGSVRWKDDLKEWQFLPTRIGRPSHSGSIE
jgi:hypothetical protein